MCFLQHIPYGKISFLDILSVVCEKLYSVSQKKTSVTEQESFQILLTQKLPNLDHHSGQRLLRVEYLNKTKLQNHCGCPSSLTIAPMLHVPQPAAAQPFS